MTQFLFLPTSIIVVTSNPLTVNLSVRVTFRCALYVPAQQITGLVVGLIHMQIKSASTEVQTKEILLNIHMYNIYAVGGAHTCADESMSVLTITYLVR